MLSPAQLDLIKATVPLLESSGEVLTRHFYQIMFRDHPEVLPLFNQANQGSGHQQRALANAVLMYARHIEELGKLGPLAEQIVNKHVSLQVLPEHYPIVGSCLLRAIREVLGEELASDAVIEAWAAAYTQLADLLIASEEAVYAANASAPGGWRGTRGFRVTRKERESDEITSFYLEPEDGAALLDFQPGQYIGLRLLLPQGEQRRNYSLSARGDGRHYRISVKREAAGLVSRHLHDNVEVGDRLELFPPAGEFILRSSDKPLALITAGVGITPALAMLEQARDSGREIHFIHCARHAGVHAFREWIERQSADTANLSHYFCYSEPRTGDQAHAQGFINAELLDDWLPENRDLDAYFLGPQPFMAQVRKHLRELGVPSGQCHYEFFGPAQQLEA